MKHFFCALVVCSNLLWGGGGNAAKLDQTRKALVDPLTDVALPTLIAQGEWTSTIVLVNLDTIEADIQLYFADSKGQDVRLPIKDVGSTSALRVHIPANGRFNVETEYRPGEAAIEGWAILVHDGISGTAGKVGGHVVLRQRDLRTVLPIATINEKVTLLPFDNTSGGQTLASVINFDTTNVRLRATAYDEDGHIVLDTDSMSVGQLERLVFNTSQVDELKNRRGVIKLESSGKLQVTQGLQLDTNAGTMNSAPTISLREWQTY